MCEASKRSFKIKKIKFGMGKKYLLTFSLAAISCLATKTIQNELEVEQDANQVEVENNYLLEIETKVQLVIAPRLKKY